MLWSACLLILFTAFAVGQDGAALYKASCTKCHGDLGKGDGPAAKLIKNQSMGDLSSKAAMSKYSDADVTKMIAEGGPAVGKSKLMPAHKDKMSAGDIKAVVAFIKTLQK